jgi:hypothetical protein
MLLRDTVWGSFCTLTIAVSIAMIGASTNAGEERAGKSSAKLAEITASVWAVREAGDTVTLATLNQTAPVMTTLTDDTRLEGVCVHCEARLQFRAGELAKRCSECPCGSLNFRCIASKLTATKSWQALLQSLPRGTRLRLEYNDTDKPEKGIKRLVVDRYGALLAVEGLAEATPEQLQNLGKSVGAAHIENDMDGSRLQLSVKDKWTMEKETRLEKELEKVGAKLAPPPAQSADQK